jgi:hypothetical protein
MTAASSELYSGVYSGVKVEDGALLTELC